MNLNLSHPFTHPMFSLIGFFALSAITAAGILAHGASAEFLNHAMSVVVLALNLCCLLALQYRHLNLSRLQQFLAYQQQDILDYNMMDELRVLTPLEFQAIIKHYRTITPQLLSELSTAITQRRTSEVLRLSRRIRSASAQVGAVKFAAAAQEIEYRACQQDLRAAPKLFQVAAKAYEEVQSELEKQE